MPFRWTVGHEPFYRVRRTPGGIGSDGRPSGASVESVTPFIGTRDPVPEEMLKLVPEGERQAGTMFIICELDLRSTDDYNNTSADWVIIGGEYWEVRETSHFPRVVPHYEARVSRIARPGKKDVEAVDEFLNPPPPNHMPDFAGIRRAEMPIWAIPPGPVDAVTIDGDLWGGLALAAPSATARPTKTASGLVFDGVDDHLAALIPPTDLSAGMTVFFVASVPTPAQGFPRGLLRLGYGEPAAQSGIEVMQTPKVVPPFWAWQAVANRGSTPVGTVQTGYTIADGVPYSVGVRMSDTSGDARFFIDGSPISGATAAAAPRNPVNRIAIQGYGAVTAAAALFGGTIQAWAVYDSFLSDDQMTAVFDHLRAKWGPF